MDNETRVAGARAKNIREAWPKVVQNDLGSFSRCNFVQYFTKSPSQIFFLLTCPHLLSFSLEKRKKSSDSSVYALITQAQQNESNQNSHHQPQHQSINDRLPPRTYRESRLQQRTTPSFPLSLSHKSTRASKSPPNYPTTPLPSPPLPSQKSKTVKFHPHT